MTLTLGWTFLAVGLLVVAYAYVGYPALLKLVSVTKRSSPPAPAPGEWPSVTIVLPVHNEEHTIAATLESVLAMDYPNDRRQVLVVSDASTDGTHEIVRRYSARGVELHILPTRRGKTAAENESRTFIRGEIVVNTDASVRLDRDALKPLVATFRDRTVGVASGRDISVSSRAEHRRDGESGYVSYEMWVRGLETKTGGIVGASGCFFASRPELHREIVPEALSRDFAAPLIARERGYRAVSVPDAICYVPRTMSLRREYRRKVRTMLRGLETLYYKRALLNPFRYGSFALKLWCHKLVRWLVPWAALGIIVGLALIAAGAPPLRWPLVALVAVVAGIMVLGWWWPPNRSMPSVLSVPSYLLFGLLAGVHAWIKALSGDLNPAWEPTRRDPVRPG